MQYCLCHFIPYWFLLTITKWLNHKFIGNIWLYFRIGTLSLYLLYVMKNHPRNVWSFPVISTFLTVLNIFNISVCLEINPVDCPKVYIRSSPSNFVSFYCLNFAAVKDYWKSQGLVKFSLEVLWDNLIWKSF